MINLPGSTHGAFRGVHLKVAGSARGETNGGGERGEFPDGRILGGLHGDCVIGRTMAAYRRMTDTNEKGPCRHRGR